MERNKEKFTYINPLGQKVVEVDYGYKVYDTDEQDKVVLYVGENTENGGYIYLDIDAIKEGRDETAYINTHLMKHYEDAIKNATSTSMPDEETMDLIKKINFDCGISGKKLSYLLESIDLNNLVSLLEKF